MMLNAFVVDRVDRKSFQLQRADDAWRFGFLVLFV